jgi:hypothetical protein
MNAIYARYIEAGDKITWNGQLETVEHYTLYTDRHVSIHLNSGNYMSVFDDEIIELA